MISESLTSEIMRLLASTTVWDEDVCWSELRAAVKARGEDAGRTHSETTDCSTPRFYWPH